MIIAFPKWLKAVACISSLAACVPTPVPLDFNRAELMPEPAAKKAIANIIPTYSGRDTLDLGGRSLSIKSIRNLLLLRNGKLDIETSSSTFAVCDASLDSARQLAEAFTALGASIKLEQTQDIDPWHPCDITLGR